MWRWIEHPYVHFLARRVYSRLNVGDTEGALAVAQRFRGRKYLVCYECLNDIHAARFDHDAVIEIWREAAEAFPGDHAVRLRLVAALSDHGRYDEALAHIKAAKALPDAAIDRIALDYNLAVILLRMGDLAAALEINQGLLADAALFHQTPGLKCFIHAQQVSLLSKLGDIQGALSFHEANVARLDMSAEEARTEQAEVWESYAAALVAADRFAEAEAAIKSGLRRDINHTDLFAVWRLMHGGSPDVERDYMQIFVISANSRSGMPHAACVVAADDVDEAIDLIKVFAPEPLRNSLSAWHVEHYERRPLAKGVYGIKLLPP